MKILPYNANVHFPVLAHFWEKHGWPAVPKRKLPPFGFVVVDGEQMVCGAFAYLCNGGTGVAVMEWLVGSPYVSGKVLVKGIKLLLDFMLHQMRELDYDTVLTSTAASGLIGLYEKAGFTVTDRDMTNLIHTG